MGGNYVDIYCGKKKNEEKPSIFYGDFTHEEIDGCEAIPTNIYPSMVHLTKSIQLAVNLYSKLLFSHPFKVKWPKEIVKPSFSCHIKEAEVITRECRECHRMFCNPAQFAAHQEYGKHNKCAMLKYMAIHSQGSVGIHHIHACLMELMIKDKYRTQLPLDPEAMPYNLHANLFPQSQHIRALELSRLKKAKSVRGFLQTMIKIRERHPERTGPVSWYLNFIKPVHRWSEDELKNIMVPDEKAQSRKRKRD